MRLILIVAVLVGLGGGAYAWAREPSDGPDLAACELHVRTNLPSGVVYRRIDVAREDTPPLSFAAFRQQAGASASVHGLGEAEDLQNQVDEYWAKSGKLALRTMVLTYRLGGEAQPRKQVCAFRLIEGELATSPTLMSNATTDTPKALDVLADLQHRRRQSRPKHSCCL